MTCNGEHGKKFSYYCHRFLVTVLTQEYRLRSRGLLDELRIREKAVSLRELLWNYH